MAANPPSPPSFTVFPLLPFELRLKIWGWALPGPRVVEVFIKGYMENESSDEEALSPSEDEECDGDALGAEEEEPEMKRAEVVGALESLSLMAYTEEDQGAEDEAEISADDLEDNVDDWGGGDDGDSASDAASIWTIEKINPKRLVYVSTSPVPTLLHVCRESRALALKKYQPRFGTCRSPPRIYFNNELDVLYFPFWSFDYGTSEFVNSVAAHEELGVQRVAFEADKWFTNRSWKSGYINYQLAPRKWPGLRQVTLLLTKLLPEGSCGSDLQPKRPKVLGAVDFVPLRANEGNLKWENNLLAETKAVLGKMEAKYPGWKGPEIRVMALTRNGVRI